MRRLIYLDNLVVRRLVLADHYYSEDQRKRLIDFYKKTFGISCYFVECPYLFLEFIGCTKDKLEINYASKIEIDEKLSLKFVQDAQVDTIDKILVKELKHIHNFVKRHIIKNKAVIKERLKSTMDRCHQDSFSQKIVNKAFGKYIWLYKKQFDTFLEILARALTWDVFVIIESNNLKALRERQLGYWYQNYNSEYPFGKIVDDLSRYYDHKFPQKNFFLKAREDMVDSKIMTLPITGYLQDNIIRRVDIVTFDTNVTSERSKLGLVSLKNIELSLGITIPKKFGHIYCLSEAYNENDPFNIEIIQNQYLIEL